MKNNNIILKNKNSCKAFTLVELAIVMIIISFLLVTMLQGQDFINSTKLYRIYKEVDVQKKALASFYTIYNYYPGDLPNACGASGGVLYNTCPKASGSNDPVSFNIFASDSNSTNNCLNGTLKGVNNCNGDGKIRGEGESFRTIGDLSKAGLLDQDYTGGAGNGQTIIDPNTGLEIINPKEEIADVSLTTANIIASFYDANAGYVPMVTSKDTSIKDSNNSSIESVKIEKEANFNGRIITILGKASTHSDKHHVAPIFTTKQALEIDNKYDDGKPWSGDIRAYITENTIPADPHESTPSQRDCIKDYQTSNPDNLLNASSKEQYNLDNNDIVCTMIFAIDDLNKY